jgi:hypothetical protein
MRRLFRLLLAAGLLAGLWVLLRELLEGGDRPPAETGAGPAEAGESAGAKERSGSSGQSNGAGELSKAELYRQAQRFEVKGRSRMSKEELARAVAEARGRLR